MENTFINFDLFTFIIGAFISIVLAGFGWLYNAVKGRIEQAENKAEGEGKEIKETVRTLEKRVLERFLQDERHTELQVQFIFEEMREIKRLIQDKNCDDRKRNKQP